MPISRSPKRGIRAPGPPVETKRPRFVVPVILIVALAVLTVAVIAVPASLVTRFLPPFINAQDFSGSLWHGSAGRIAVNGRDAGAVEWRLHPWSLLRLTVSADLHWVKVGFVADGSADVNREGFALHDIEGDGPVEDLADMGVAAGWHGMASFKFTQLKGVFAGGAATLVSAVGDVSVSKIAYAQIADGVDLGGYVLHVPDGAITPDADATAELNDTGGPLEVHATIHFSAKDHTGILSGTVKERAGAPPALLAQIDNLTLLRPRDGQGRVPVELEFTL
jgi:Type II secretion system (T2SS), protein N